jgi:hypothetical protein
MSGNICDTYDYRGHTVEIHYDDNPESPREWDNLGKMVVWGRNIRHISEENYGCLAEWLRDHMLAYEDDTTPFRPITKDMRAFVYQRKKEPYMDGIYTFYDYIRDLENEQWQAVEEAVERVRRLDEVIFLPMTIITEREGRAWTSEPGDYDMSGADGVYYVYRSDVLKEWKTSRITAALRAKVERCLQAEIKTYSQYLSGDVYGYVIVSPDGEEWVGDSCWGFYDDDDQTYMRNVIEAEIDGHIEHLGRKEEALWGQNEQREVA